MSHNKVTQAIPVFDPKATLATLLDRTPENQRVTAMQTEEQKGREGKKVEVGRVRGGEAVMLAQPTRHSRDMKRKLDIVDENNNPDEETISSHLPRIAKRIRREKTGMDWQSVLDIVRHGEEQQANRMKSFQGGDVAVLTAAENTIY
ncbi:hypothetical protein EV702DRAFT_1049321 [Suillus placidus]|uniref:Uncharacterized protein n=1 Tax=Suillus placidus TaxID=48579 RepID=A0A9P7CZ30_9AGAM|nr:hypothetical protein EV702DRAFT_1049321 [Suillus placidus]